MNVTGRLYWWSILLCVAVLLAACGEDDNAQFASASSAAAIPRVIDQLHTDAVFTVPGLGAGTEVVFDELGMPHVYAPDRESALFVQGYLTARDRFWEMDAFRRVAEGRLSEIFGKLTLATDVQMRTVFTTRDGRRIEEALWQLVQQTDPEITRLLQAYAGGVNAWLADLRAGRNGATLPPEYKRRPSLWRVCARVDQRRDLHVSQHAGRCGGAREAEDRFHAVRVRPVRAPVRGRR